MSNFFQLRELFAVNLGRNWLVESHLCAFEVALFNDAGVDAFQPLPGPAKLAGENGRHTSVL